MTQPSLTALLQQFQKLNPDAPGQELLEQLVGIVEQLRATPTNERAEFPFAFHEAVARVEYDPAIPFTDATEAGIAVYVPAAPLRVQGKGWLIGHLRLPGAVMMAHALAEAIAHAGKVRPYKARPTAPEGEDIPY
jgi:hypothetical protein